MKIQLSAFSTKGQRKTNQDKYCIININYMKLIEPSVELIEQEPGIEGIYKQIERAGRICYKSEDKMEGKDVTKVENINGTNVTIRVYRLSEPFVKMLIERKHNAMLEHGTVYLKFPDNTDYINLSIKYNSNPYSIIKWDKHIGKDAGAHVTTNYRVLVENNWLDDLQYICEPTKYHEKRYTLKFTTSIGITRELIRHRHFSFANESTRYCNYSKDKFGNEITFVIPYWLKNLPFLDKNGHFDANSFYRLPSQPYIESAFLSSCLNAETYYKGLIEKGIKPQEAREVLPLCTKSEIVMTGFESDWDAFFKLRCDKAAHPDMQIIANKAKEIIDNEKSKIV